MAGSPLTWAELPDAMLGVNRDLGAYHREHNPKNMSAARQRRWLHNSRSWAGLNHKEWRPSRVLGAGANGLVGLWDYCGDNPDMPRHIAIKQTDSDDDGPKWESKLLRELGVAKSKHIVKIYKEVYSEGGTGADKTRDPLPYANTTIDYLPRGEVSRMYLEYCEDGDLHHHMATKFGNDWRTTCNLPEELMWRYLDCLARALLVLERGTEDPDAEPLLGWIPICHFDIKPANILVGEKDAEHQRTHILKLTDFGLALKYLDPTDPEWIRHSSWRGTEGFLCPEQKLLNHDNRRIGPETNVWAVGAVMHYIMQSSHQEDIVLSAFPYKFQNGDEFKTMGLKLLETKYSRKLVELVLRCLTWDPDHRITPSAIMRETRAQIAEYDTKPSQIDAATPDRTSSLGRAGSSLNSSARRQARQRMFTIDPVSTRLGFQGKDPSPVRAFAPPVLIPPHTPPGPPWPRRDEYMWREGGFLAADPEGEESPPPKQGVDNSGDGGEDAGSDGGSEAGSEAEKVSIGTSADPDEPDTPVRSSSSSGPKYMRAVRRGGKRRMRGGKKRAAGIVRVEGGEGGVAAVVVEERRRFEEEFQGQACWGAYNGLPVVEEWEM